MTKLENRIDFMLFFSVDMANPNGDPQNGNQPRQDFNGYGETTPECIKRKLRNSMRYNGQELFVQSDGIETDDYKSLEARFKGEIPKEVRKDYMKTIEEVCKKWIDVRLFGQVFAYSGDSKGNGVSIGIKGPVTIQYGKSINPVDIRYFQITKSVNGTETDGKSSDRIGGRYVVDHGLYYVKGSINPEIATTTGLSVEDVEVFKEALLNVFRNDESSARPAGSMNVVKVIWWEHDCLNGQYPTRKIYKSVKVNPDTEEITVEEISGLKTEIFDFE